MSEDEDEESGYLSSENESTANTESTAMTGKTDETNFEEVDYTLETMTDTIAILNEQINAIEEHLKSMERPIAELALEQFDELGFLETSPFRHQTFALKPPGLPSIDITKRYAYKDILNALRNYLFNNRLVNPDGTVRMNPLLSKLFEIPESTTTYLKLLAGLRKVLV
jgi:hypothetical protein